MQGQSLSAPGSGLPTLRPRHERFLYTGAVLDWLSVRVSIRKISLITGVFIGIIHTHKLRELCFITDGEGWMHVVGKNGAEDIALCKGSLVYLSPDMPHRLHSNPARPLQACVIPLSFTALPDSEGVHTPANWIENERQMLKMLDEYEYITASDCFGCFEDLDTIIRTLEDGPSGGCARAKNYVSNLLLDAMLSLYGKSQTVSFIDDIDDKVVNGALEIIDYMQKNFMEGITLSDVAEALHYSRRHCHRLLLQVLGVNFSDLLLDFRLHNAMELLLNTDASLNVIAERSGFKSGKSMGEHFKKQFGTTPYRYRKNSRRPPPENGQKRGNIIQ